MIQTQFSKIHKKSSAQMQTAKAKAAKAKAAKAKTAQPQATKAKWDRLGTAKTAKPLPTKCANSTKKENAGMAKSAEMNIPNSAKNLSNTGF